MSVRLTARVADWLLSDEPIDQLDDDSMRILDEFSHELALIASEDPSPPTPEEQVHLDALDAFVKDLIAGRIPVRRARRRPGQGLPS